MIKSNNKHILIVCPYETASYILSDIKTIRNQYSIRVLNASKMPFPKKINLILHFLLSLIIYKVDLVLVYIAVPQYTFIIALLSKLFGKRILVITGGYEITYISEINWGEMNSSVKRFFQKIAFKIIDKVLAYSEASRADIIKYTKANPSSVKVLYFGVDSDYFKPNELIKKKDLIITVCANVASYSIKPKGVITFLEIARSLPHINFKVIGKVHDDVKEFVSSAPENVSFTGKLSDSELLQLYQEAKVYVQLSAHEGFGIANIEAMSCGCASVVTPAAALPEIVGQDGLYAPFGDIENSQKSIVEALNRDDLRERARNRIKVQFQSKNREEKLLSEISDLLN